MALDREIVLRYTPRADRRVILTNADPRSANRVRSRRGDRPRQLRRLGELPPCRGSGPLAGDRSAHSASKAKSPRPSRWRPGFPLPRRWSWLARSRCSRPMDEPFRANGWRTCSPAASATSASRAEGWIRRSAWEEWRDRALRIDFRPVAPARADSGSRRTGGSSWRRAWWRRENRRVRAMPTMREFRECREALRESRVTSHESRDYSDLLSLVSRLEAVERARPHLDDLHFRRFRHVVTEALRVDAAVWRFAPGRPHAFGALLSASHASLRDDYEVSSVGARSAGGDRGARRCGGARAHRRRLRRLDRRGGGVTQSDGCSSAGSPVLCSRAGSASAAFIAASFRRSLRGQSQLAAAAGSYSARNASIGSSPAARRAGIQVAASPTASSSSAPAANVTGIERPHTIEHSRQQSRREHRRRPSPARIPAPASPAPIAEHHAKHPLAIGPEGHAHPDFPGPLAGDVAHHAKDSGRGQPQSGEREAAESRSRKRRSRRIRPTSRSSVVTSLSGIEALSPAKTCRTDSVTAPDHPAYG